MQRLFKSQQLSCYDFRITSQIKHCTHQDDIALQMIVNRKRKSIGEKSVKSAVMYGVYTAVDLKRINV
jgi:hypothetical protein